MLAGSVFYNSHQDALVVLKRGSESIGIPNVAQIVHDENDVTVLRSLGQNVIVDFSYELLLAFRAKAELQVDGQVES